MNPVVVVVLGVLLAAVAGSSGRRRSPPVRRIPFPVPGASLSKRRALGYLYQRSPTHKHRGIDVPAPEGSPVVSPFGGVVVQASGAYASGYSGYGKVVVVRVPAAQPFWMLFAHLASVDVIDGQHISLGQQVGTVGRTSYRRDDRDRLFVRSNAHLHFETAMHPYPMAAEAPRVDPVAMLGLV